MDSAIVGLGVGAVEKVFFEAYVTGRRVEEGVVVRSEIRREEEGGSGFKLDNVEVVGVVGGEKACGVNTEARRRGGERSDVYGARSDRDFRL